MRGSGSLLFSLLEKTILVTGASRGNGLAICKGLTDHGASVIGLDKAPNDDAGFPIFEVDLTNRDKTSALLKQLILEFGSIHGLVNNAGVSLASDDPYNDADVYEKTLSINLNAVFHLSSLFCAHTTKSRSGGSIINITSLGAEQGFPDNPSYQISKAGVKQMTKAFACDWGGKGIRVNNICPGYIKTSMTEGSFNDPILNQQRRGRTMLNRWGESSDLIGAAVFLLSDASSYITGSTIYVDGGWTSKGF